MTNPSTCSSFRFYQVPILVFALVVLMAAACNQKPDLAPSPLLFLPDDLEATLWAESPMFYNPTNLDVDAKGRIWVTEAVNYRNYNNDSTKLFHHQGGDRVMILEDTDQDGKADTAKVFVQDKDLVSPLGIAVIGNAVYVSCSPNLIVYTDINGDDVPDRKEIFLTGFGGKDHDHSLHAIVAGPDGNFYFNTGNAGPHEVKDKAGWTLRSGSIYTGGSPYNEKNSGNRKSDDGRIWVGGLALRIGVDGKGLSVMGHNFRNSYEVAVDSRGDLWQNDNDDQVVACRTSWLMEGGNAGYFSTDGTRYWQADQRPWNDVFTAHWHQDDPGVMPAGDRTGAGAPTGVVVNESDALGEKYRGLLLSADAGRNIIFGYYPKRKDSGYDLGDRSNFITSLTVDNPRYVWNDSLQNTRKDNWFRPSDVAIGTDGAIYVADWYDPVVGGHQMKDSVGYGRIYRITPKGKKLTNPTINLETVAGQIEALKNPAVNVRYVAFEKLKQGGENSFPQVEALLQSSNPYEQARAVWLLAQLGEKGIAKTEQLLNHEDVGIRTVAFRALRQTKDIIPYAATLVLDSSAWVRREVVIALRDLPFTTTKPILLNLIKGFDGSDRWYLEALGATLQGHETEIYPDMLQLLNSENKPSDQWSQKLSALTWRLHPPVAIDDLTYRASSDKLTREERTKAVTALAFINTQKAVQSMIALSKNKLTDVAEQAAYWLSFRQSNDWFALVDWKKTGIDTKRQRNLAAMQVKRIKMVDELLPFDERKWNAHDMAKDALGGQMLLGMAAEKLLPADLLSEIGTVIFQNPDPTVRIQASLYFKKEGQQNTLSIPAIVKLADHVEAGKEIFETNCASCHRLAGKGLAIGPELTDIRKKFDREALLDAIINPSAGIVFGYEPWTIALRDGQAFFGFVVADGAQAVVIKDLTGKQHTLAVTEISSRKKLEKSLMPDPVSLNLTEQNLADLAAYLLSFD